MRAAKKECKDLGDAFVFIDPNGTSDGVSAQRVPDHKQEGWEEAHRFTVCLLQRAQLSPLNRWSCRVV